MGLTNALLVRTAYGWDEAISQGSIDNYGRREALYGLGAFDDANEVQRVAAARFAISDTPRYQWDAVHRPELDGDLAYHGYVTGDSLPVNGTPERVQSLQVTEDPANGRTIVTPSLHDVVMYASPLDNFLALLGQATKKMRNGTSRGDWKEAQPVTPPGTLKPVGVPPAPVETCGYFDAVPVGDVNVGSIGTITSGNSSVQQLFGITSSTSTFYIYTVIARHPTLGGGSLPTSGPNLSGGGVTWMLLHETPTYDWNDGAGIRSYRAWFFLGCGSLNGDVFFSMGTAQGANIQVGFGVTGVRHVAATFDSIRQYAVADDGYAVLPSSPASCSGIIGAGAGESHGSGFSAEGGILGISNVGLNTVYNPADPTRIYQWGPVAQEDDGAFPTGGSVMVELIPLP